MSLLRNMSFEWLVGMRYTRASRRSRNSFISVISLISMAGIALGVAALIIVLSVWNGFQTEVRDRMLSVLSHIEVFDARGAMVDWEGTAREAMQHEQVIGAAPFVLAQAMVTRDSSVRGVAVRGVLPRQEGEVSDVTRQMFAGDFDSLRRGEYNIVIGRELARALDIELGERIALVTPSEETRPGGAMPRLQQFTVSGIFEAGHHQYDASLAFIHMADAMDAYQLQAPSGIRLRVTDMREAPQIAYELSRSLSGDLYISDWSRHNRIWFAAVQSQKTMMFLILTLIVAVAAFNLVSSLVMTVTDKQADIAILRTLGASPRAIMKIFIVQGTLVGLTGTLIGIALGLLVALNIDVIIPFIEGLLGANFLPTEVYFISALPSDVRWSDVALVSAVSIVLAFLATIYPSWAAARVKPAEALRYE
jgi:lipoprotein-releasing system permease protein